MSTLDSGTCGTADAPCETALSTEQFAAILAALGLLTFLQAASLVGQFGAGD